MERTHDVFTRACVVHHPNKPWINLYWAAFEESRGKSNFPLKIVTESESDDNEMFFSKGTWIGQQRS